MADLVGIVRAAITENKKSTIGIYPTNSLFQKIHSKAYRIDHALRSNLRANVLAKTNIYFHYDSQPHPQFASNIFNFSGLCIVFFWKNSMGTKRRHGV